MSSTSKNGQMRDSFLLVGRGRPAWSLFSLCAVAGCVRPATWRSFHPLLGKGVLSGPSVLRSGERANPWCLVPKRMRASQWAAAARGKSGWRWGEWKVTGAALLDLVDPGATPLAL